MFDHYYCILQLFLANLWRNCPDFANIHAHKMVVKMTLVKDVLKILLSGRTSNLRNLKEGIIFSFQFRKIITRYRRIGYNLDCYATVCMLSF